jgi:hypothetical protein
MVLRSQHIVLPTWLHTLLAHWCKELQDTQIAKTMQQDAALTGLQYVLPAFKSTLQQQVAVLPA